MSPLCLLCTLPCSLHMYLQDGTALIIASQNRHDEVVQLLIEKGADVNISDNVRYITVWLPRYVCICVHV